jgi:hypothetical protein
VYLFPKEAEALVRQAAELQAFVTANKDRLVWEKAPA